MFFTNRYIFRGITRIFNDKFTFGALRTPMPPTATIRLIPATSICSLCFLYPGSWSYQLPVKSPPNTDKTAADPLIAFKYIIFIKHIAFYCFKLIFPNIHVNQFLNISAKCFYYKTFCQACLTNLVPTIPVAPKIVMT